MSGLGNGQPPQSVPGASNSNGLPGPPPAWSQPQQQQQPPPPHSWHTWQNLPQIHIPNSIPNLSSFSSFSLVPSSSATGSGYNGYPPPPGAPGSYSSYPFTYPGPPQLHPMSLSTQPGSSAPMNSQPMSGQHQPTTSAQPGQPQPQLQQAGASATTAATPAPAGILLRAKRPRGRPKKVTVNVNINGTPIANGLDPTTPPTATNAAAASAAPPHGFAINLSRPPLAYAPQVHFLPPAPAPVMQRVPKYQNQNTNMYNVNMGLGHYGSSSSYKSNVIEPPLPAALPAVVANPACPPNWTQSLQQATTQVQSPYLKIPVLDQTAEYREVGRLFGADMVSVERVVNPMLWKRFTQARLDLLVSKTDDLSLLTALGLSEEEVAQRAHVSLNFDRTHLNGSPYSDNVVLLFHGSKGHNAVDKILSQGLDERLGNTGGLLGRGIYFSDDPRKAMQYDTNGMLVVFAVMLGDCLAINGQNGSAVREPEKNASQRRNHQDLFFDSIVGRPTGVNNEYVIYNRAQCCPVYTIAYNKWAMPSPQPVPFHPPNNRALTPDEELTFARNQLPSLAWNYGGRQQATPSPFYARKIFQAMAADQIGPAEGGAAGGVPRGSGPTTSANMKTQDEFQEEESLMLQLSQLTELGFTDDTKNKGLLRKFGFNLERTIDYLLTAGPEDAVDARAQDQADSEAGAVGGASAPTANNGAASKPIASTSASAAASCLPSTSKGITVSSRALASAPKFDETIDLTDDTLNDQTGSSPSTPPRALSSKRLCLTTPDWLDSLLKCYDVSPKDMSISESADGANGNTGSGEGGKGEEDKTGEEEPLNKSEPASPASPADSECPICFVEYDPAGSDWETLSCQHKICTTCCTQMRSTGTTMSGQTHTYLKCPFCQSCSGIQIGTCPTGSMTVVQSPMPAAGYEGVGSLSIRYYVQSGQYLLDRTAYLPDNAEGQRILGLLRIAWDRRLCFTIGTSMTTGASNVLVWNIHHKTGLRGGAHGYPDPTYLQRVAQELSQYGIQ